MMDVIELLKHQHRDALKMIARLGAEDKLEESDRLELFDHLKEALTLHTRMEEEIFYPALDHFKEMRELVAESYQEHHQVDLLLQKISELGSGARHGKLRDNERDGDWRSLLNELTADVTHHVDEEENELFPRAQRLLTPDRIKEMGYEMRGIRSGQSKRDQLIYPASRLGPI